MDYDWGIDVHIPAPPNAKLTPLPYSSLGCHPLGLYDLRRRLGALKHQPGIYHKYQSNFDAADLAWFVPGLSQTPSTLSPTNFFPQFLDMMENTPKGIAGNDMRRELRRRVRELTFDSAALWDRAFGGTTLVVHVEGATRPNTPKVSEYIKADVYFPAHLHQEDARFSLAVSDIVQRYIKDIGVPTIERFERCARRLWTFNQKGPIPSPLPAQDLLPASSPQGSSVFVYHGRPASSGRDGPTDSPSPPTRKVIVIDSDTEDEEPKTPFGQCQSCSELDATKELLRQAEDSLADANRRERELLAQLNRIWAIVEAFAPSATSRTSLPSQHPETPQRHTSPLQRGSGVKPSPSGHVRSYRRSILPAGAQVSASPSLSQFYAVRPSTKPGPGSDLYSQFIDSNDLDDLFPAIDLIRRTTIMYQWETELLNIGVPANLLEGLMEYMSGDTQPPKPSQPTPFV